jgi:hypothetical protein
MFGLRGLHAFILPPQQRQIFIQLPCDQYVPIVEIFQRTVENLLMK